MSAATIRDALRSRLPGPGTLAVLVAATLVFAIRATEVVNIYDEFLPLVCAQRISAGEVPYRDFHTHYPPLLSLVFAVVFTIAPGSLIATRLALAAILIATCVLVGRVAAWLGDDERVGAACGITAALTLDPVSGGATIALATTLLLAALVALEQARRWAGNRAWWIVAGLSLGLAVTARHDLAFAGGVVVVLFGASVARSRKLGRAPLARMLGVAAIPPVAAFIWLGATGALDGAMRDLVLFAATYAEARRVPWPGPEALGSWAAVVDFYGPLAIAVAVAIRLGLDRRAGVTDGAAPLALAALGLTVVGYQPGLVRSDLAHVVLARLAAIATLGVLARGPRRGARLALLAVATTLVLPGACLHAGHTAELLRSLWRDGLSTSPERAGLGRASDIDADRRQVLELCAALPPGARIWVGLKQHDRIWGNDVALYFDAGRLPATRYHELEPWCARESFQRAIVAELALAPPALIVLEGLAPPFEPNESAIVHPSRTLDVWLQHHYRVKTIRGGYAVLEPR